VVEKYASTFPMLHDDRCFHDKEWLCESVSQSAEMRLPLWAASGVDCSSQNPLLTYQLRGLGFGGLDQL